MTASDLGGMRSRRAVSRAVLERRAAGVYASDGSEERSIDGMSRTEIIEAYTPKISVIARQIYSRLPDSAQLELGDLINTGALGLLDAIEKFDPNKNTKFSTYIHFRIRGAMLDLLRGFDAASRGVRERSREIQKTIGKLEHALGRAPASKEIADDLGITVEAYHRDLYRIRSASLVSLDAPVKDVESDQLRLGDTVSAEDAPRPDQVSDRREALMLVRDAMDEGLNDRLKTVLILYYFKEMNLAEIGLTLGVSESRVSQLHTEACLRLRARLAKHLRPGQTFDKKRLRPVRKNSTKGGHDG